MPMPTEQYEKNPQQPSLSLKPIIPLTALRRNLHRRTLRSLLALNPARLTLSCTRSGLSLLRLLRALGSRLLLLAGCNCRLTCCFAGFGALCSSLLDYV